ncbi:MAG: sulfotransferase family 2 domain-containing protein [Saprospiraceae bacterium]
MVETLKADGKKAKREPHQYHLTKGSQRYQRFSHWLLRRFKKLPSDQSYNISISHQKKLIWYRVAKVSSRTIFDVLKRASVVLDAEHPMWCHYPANDYNGYFRFAFVRNPWDRLVSCWLNKVVKANYYQFSEEKLIAMQDFKNFVGYVAQIDVKTCDDAHIRLQASMIDLNHVDFVGRFERFEVDFRKVLDILGIDEIEISKKNASKNRKSYHTYYDEKTKEKVAEIYKKDIQIFNYQF